MPVVEITKITRPEHAVEALAEKIAGSTLGFKSVTKYDDLYVQEYPAVRIMAGHMNKELGGTHTFDILLRADIYVMHANMSEDRPTRNLNDLMLATDLVAYLEEDMSLTERLIHSWIESETPGIMPPRSRGDGLGIISTRLSWQGITRGRF